MEWENQLRTIASFYFEPAGNYRYEAGQYASLSLPHPDFDSRGYSRTMTLSSSPTEKLLKFTMRLLPIGGSSFKRALTALRPGDQITVFESMGDLILPMDSVIPLVFVAGGVGIASFTGMVQWLADNHEQRDIHFHYIVPRANDFVMQQPFNDYEAWQKSGGFAPIRRLTYINRRPSIAQILQSSPPECLFYASGTEAMVSQIVAGLVQAGVKRQQIVFDYFDGYSEL